MSIAIGAHVDQTDPIAEAKARNTSLVQFFLGDPQGYKGPEIRYAGGAEGLKADSEAAGIGLYVHAPYIVNVATTNNRIRIPSRKLLQQHMDAAAQIPALQALMDRHVGAQRNEAGLKAALSEIRHLKTVIADCPPPAGAFATARRDWFDLRNMLDVAEAIAVPALAREESRGAHQREDCSDSRPEWEVNQVARLRAGRIELSASRHAVMVAAQ